MLGISLSGLIFSKTESYRYVYLFSGSNIITSALLLIFLPGLVKRTEMNKAKEMAKRLQPTTSTKPSVEPMKRQEPPRIPQPTTTRR